MAATNKPQMAMATRLVWRDDLGANRFDAMAGIAGDEARWHSVALDSSHDERAAAGVSPMELLLVALGGCMGISVVSMLDKMRQDVTTYAIRVTGERSSGWPVVFTAIAIEHRVTGHALDAAAIERALTLAETRYCGVSAMLGQAVPITHTLTLGEG